MAEVYTLQIVYEDGAERQYPFHLGTMKFEALREGYARADTLLGSSAIVVKLMYGAECKTIWTRRDRSALIEQAFVRWLSSRDPGETYSYISNEDCCFARFAKEYYGAEKVWVGGDTFMLPAPQWHELYIPKGIVKSRCLDSRCPDKLTMGDCLARYREYHAT